jgi:hypothetical protein
MSRLRKISLPTPLQPSDGFQFSIVPTMAFGATVVNYYSPCTAAASQPVMCVSINNGAEVAR